MAQNEVRSVSNPARVTAIGGDNATEFNLFFPFMPPGSQWVFPFTYGFMYVVDTPSYQPVKIDASQTPPGAQPPVATTKIANLVAYDSDNQTFNPGIISTSSGSVPASTFFRQIGAGGNTVVAGIANQTIKVYSILFSVDTAAAGGFAIVSDDTVTQVVAQIQANTISSVPYTPTIPIPLGIGKGLRVSILTGGNCSFSISYIQG